MKLAVLALLALVGLLPACSSGEQDIGQWRIEQPTNVEGPLQCRAATIPGTTTVRMTLRNRGSESVHALKWGTPWDEKADVFSVGTGSSAARYQGLTAIRRGEPPPNAYLEIPAGNSVSIEYNVGRAYALNIGEEYDIALKESSLLARLAGKTVALAMICGRGTLSRTSVEELGESQQPLHPYYAGCNTQQEAGIINMNVIAANATRAAEALTYAGSPLYDRWFGDWSSSRASFVHSYVARYNTLDWEVRCGGADCCDDGAIACRVPTIGSDRLYVCPIWWNNPDVGLTAQSRFLTLVHEHTHLDVGALDGTDDIRDVGQCGGDCYGYWNALNLANDVTCVGTSDSCKAVRNAENHAFFASDALFGAMAVATML